ncbi:uncharacterized protein LOC134279584 isoform X2 [Saccostrea cucullata]|uniref:uncharacterized protein LOC134279584 isoform X2 n=1 Tax=Saccostrea cuccullata TaxID=36930 RepID=UPI002ED21479
MNMSLSLVVLCIVIGVSRCCFINPCNFGGFCQNGGTCSLREDCVAVCECPPGYSGDRCQTYSNGSTNDCDLCLENQTCVQSQKGNNSWSCITMTTTTVSLVTSDTVDTNISREVCSVDYVNRTKAERTCLGFECTFGFCNKSYEYVGGIQMLTAKCVCDPGATGTKCEFQCCLDCGHGFCQYSISEKEPFCNCDPEYMGEKCSELRPVKGHQTSDPGWLWWLVGGCILVFLVLVLLLVAVPYCLWKKRVLVVMKIAYFFQPYEDNDDKVWDAFVSYKSAGPDEDFVLHKLQPVLEDQLGFRLCLHYRDFVIGAAIFENIIEAINNSRRTILVLSPRFLNSEWTRYEYQVALQEMLKKKHRIIPVILEDISDVEDIDETLKQILSSITYIKWPDTEKKEKHFWKTLQLSLPKRRMEISSGSDSTGVSCIEPPSPVDSQPTSLSSTDNVINSPSKDVISDINGVNIEVITDSYIYNNIAYVNNIERSKSSTITNSSKDPNLQFLGEKL